MCWLVLFYFNQKQALQAKLEAKYTRWYQEANWTWVLLITKTRIETPGVIINYTGGNINDKGGCMWGDGNRTEDVSESEGCSWGRRDFASTGTQRFLLSAHLGDLHVHRKKKKKHTYKKNRNTNRTTLY